MEKRNYEASWVEERKINKEAGDIIIDIAKWTKFLSIVGFIFIGLSLLALIGFILTILGMNSYMENYDNTYSYTPGVIHWGFVIAYCVIILIYFLPILFLYRFSVKIKKSITINNTSEIADAFSFLKKHYVYVGILTIIMLAFFIVSFAMMFVGYATAM